MKTRHAVLLIAGAALAAALAVQMTQPQPILVAPAPASARVNEAGSPTPTVNAAPAKPAPVRLPPAKSSSIAIRLDPAPAPVYVEPAIRKNKPISAPRSTPVIAKEMPPFLPPVPYDPPVEAQPAPKPEPAPALQPKPSPSPRQVTLPAGMAIPVQLGQSFLSDHVIAGDTFQGSLAQPLIVNGLVIAERGSRVAGRIAGAQRVRADGTSTLELELTSLATADGQQVGIATDPWIKRGDGAHGEVAAATIVRFHLASRVTIRERQL